MTKWEEVIHVVSKVASLSMVYAMPETKNDTLINTYKMLLLKGEAGSIPPPAASILLLLLFVAFSLNQSLLLQTSYILAGVGIAAALVTACFLISRTMRGRRVKSVLVCIQFV